MQRLLYGAFAGFAATMAMTATAERLWKLLPSREQYPLPPREITQRVLESAGVEPSDDTTATAAMTAHFAYGAITGALFPLLTRRRSFPLGAGYGLAVWAVSYLGWLPATRILAPPTRHPIRRTLLMLCAHAAWGAALSSGLRRLEQADTALQGKRTPDAP
jgi:hypothetical protein